MNIRITLPHYSSESEHGHVHGDENHGDQQSDEHDQGGFKHCAHALDAVFEFFGERLALAAGDLGKAGGFFADTDQNCLFPIIKSSPRLSKISYDTLVAVSFSQHSNVHYYTSFLFRVVHKVPAAFI